MATPSVQPDPQIVSAPEVVSISNPHRWTDLALVMAVAFATSIVGSLYRAFYPAALNYSNIRFLVGILDEAIALALFLVLFKRQGRRLSNIGFGFRWTDIPKALGLTLAGFAALLMARSAMRSVYYFATLNALHEGPRWNVSGASLWIIVPFMVLNGFFEEMLVRGYLMTELIDLRKSVVFAAVVSLAVQTSYHLYYGVFGAAMVGCGLSVFAIYYAITRRLMPVILAHMFWDLTTVFLKLYYS